MRVCTNPRFSFFPSFVSMIKALSSQPSAISSSSQIAIREVGESGQLTANRLFCSCLSNLLLQTLADIGHALILVWVRRSVRAHFVGDLPHLLPINARQRDASLLRIDGGIHASWQRVLDRMGIPQAEHDLCFAIHLGAIPDADDFQFPRPAPGYAFDSVVYQRASQSVHR